MNYVIDCSTAFKWVVAEPDSAKGLRLRDDFKNGITVLYAPDLFPTEIANALMIAERRGRIGPGEGAVLLGDVMKTLPLIGRSHLFLPRAYEIAQLHQATVYDCLFVALAEHEVCDFVTADDKLVKKLQSTFPFVISLASLP
ncbi:MAG: type II toxin-antitoxin system VapC family toxin [Planctomycetes bacterium]|nr:type II toxin-antitoxin system VapC family toxin [Planctomycetota bacterium]